MNNIKKRVYEFINKYKLINKGEHIIVGVSGGADSVCLLSILNELSKKFDLKLTAIHINHMIRGEEALRDESFVIRLCNSLGIDVIVERINVLQMAKDKKISEEEAGREARYSTFYRYKEELDANKIAVAHNKNDNAETVIMNIIRGSGLSGLKGIDIIRDDIIRPIMVLKRNEIEDYCKLNGLEYVTDSTNKEPIYTRNKIRLKLIDKIDDIFNIDIVSKIDQMTYLIKDDNAYIEESSQKAFSDCKIRCCDTEILIDIDKFSGFHKSIQRKVLRKAILEIKKDINGIEYKHIESILELVEGQKTGKRLELPQNIRVYRDYNILMIYLKKDEQEKFLGLDVLVSIGYSIRMKIDDVFEIEVEHLTDKSQMKTKDVYTKYFDYDRLKPSVTVRRREDGDIFKPLNSNGTKKLKKYFIDKKVSKLERDKLYLLAKGNEIVWILGDRISDNFKVTEETNNIVRITFIPICGKNN